MPIVANSEIHRLGVIMHRKVFSITLIGIILFGLIGCSSLTPTEYYTPELTPYIIPEIGLISKANIGDPLLREGVISEQNTIILRVPQGTKGWTAYHPIGNYTLIGKDGEFLIYQFGTQQPNGWNFVYPQLLKDESGQVYTKTNSGTKFLPEVNYTITNIAETKSDNYEQTLVYTGAEGNILKFTYREFVSDMARPAFTIDATYDLTKDKIIKFKNVTIEVIEYTNQEITYRLLSGFKN